MILEAEKSGFIIIYSNSFFFKKHKKKIRFYYLTTYYKTVDFIILNPKNLEKFNSIPKLINFNLKR